MEEFQLERKFNFHISTEEWQENIYIQQTHSGRCLKGFIKIFKQKVAEKNPQCALVFKYNRVRKAASRKGNAPFFHSKASCKFKGCTAMYNFIIKTKVKQGDQVKVKVKVTGEKNHVKPEMLQAALRDSPTKLAHQDYDIVREIEIIREITSNLVPGGFVQYIAVYPMKVVMYTVEQIQKLSGLLKNGPCTVFMDATNSLVTNLASRAQEVLYYALVVEGSDENSAIPMAEFILEDQSYPEISNFLTYVRYALQRADPEMNVPQKFVVNYKWTWMNAVNLAFNDMSTLSYLKHVWDDGIGDPPCKVHICSTQVMRAVAVHLCDVDVKLKYFILLCVACLIVSTSKAKLDKVFSLMCKTLVSKQSPSENVMQHLQSQIVGVSIDYDQDKINNEAPTEGNEHTKWLTESPYYKHYHSIKMLFDSEEEAGSNPYYAPEFMDHFLHQFMSIAPMWTSILGSTLTTNMPTRNWFQHVKHNILNKKRLGPGQFVRAMAGSLGKRSNFNCS